MSNFFRSLFGAKKAAKVTKSRMQSRRLELLGLEERITPVITATLTGTVLDITTTAGEDIVSIVSASNGVITINATTAGGTAVAVTQGAGVTVGGSAGANTLTLTTPANLTRLDLIGDAIGNQDFTITGISSSGYNAAFGLSVNMGADVVGPDTLNFTTGTVTLGTGNLATSNIDAITIAAAADITAASSGTVGISATTISTAGDVTTATGLTTYTGAVTLTGAIANASTSGGVSFSSTVNGAFGITTTASAAAPVTFTGIVGGTTPVGAISVTTAGGAINAAAVTATSLTTSSGAGNVSVGALTTTGAVSVTATGTIGFTGAVSAASVATVSASGGAVTLGGTVTTTGATNFAGAVTGTSVNVVAGTTATITGVVTSSGAISVVGAGVVTLTGGVGTGSLNTGVTVTSTADNVVISGPVTSGNSGASGAVAISAATAGKTISLAGAVTAGLNSNILLTGDVLSNNASAVVLSAAGGIGNGNITITGKVDASVAGNDLTLTAGSGIVTLTGNVGSSSTVFGTLTASGTGIFLASGTVNAAGVDLDDATNDFATSITFAKAVTATGATSADGVVVAGAGAGTITFSDAITVSGTASSSAATIDIGSVSGAIKVVGAITGLDLIAIDSTSGAITLSGAVTTSGTNTSAFDGDIVIGTGTSGNVLLSGNISTTGTGDIALDNDGTGTLTINGNVSTAATSATNGLIFIGADSSSTATGGTSVTINGTVTTTGTAAGDIIIGVSGGSVAVNNTVTAGAKGNVIFVTVGATDAITIASGKNIIAGDGVADFGLGILNLGGNITAGTASIAANGGILLDNGTVNLTGAVILKSIGTGSNSDITLASVNGNQNLTLEANDEINLASVGQTTALNTVTVTNSAGVNAGPFSAAKVVLTDSTNTIDFGGTTIITTSLTTAAKAYGVTFTGTSVLSGAPVFLNTGGVSFAGTTSLTTGATITGNATSTASLAGTIVSGGAFNIGATTNTGVVTIADGTQLILNSTTAASTFANPITISGAAGTLSLLGVGTLTLSGDSASGTTGDSISVINGTLNVTGKLGATSVSTATSGTVTGAGGTIGILNVNTGTVAPGGTLKTAAVTLNAATSYSVAVLTTSTASNLETAAAINLGNAVLNVTSVASGLKVGNQITIINNTAASTAINGTFAGLAEGATVSGAKDAAGNTVTYTISYKGTDGKTGNDAVLTVASVTTTTPAPTAPAQPMVAGQPALLKFTAVGADAGGGPLVTVTFQNGTFVSFFAYASTFRGGVRVALGDVNGDGSTDVVTGAGPGGGPQVNVYNVNSATGAVSLQSSHFAFSAPGFTGGIYVAAGDTNDDGFDDIIVGAGATGGSRVSVYAGSASGAITSSTLNDFFAYSSVFTGGVVVAAGDRNADGDEEIITAPASGGGYNIKSFDGNGTGNNPIVVDNFFAFNNSTTVGGLSLAVGLLNSGSIADLIIGTNNGGYGVIIDSATSGIVGTPFSGFTGAIRAGVAENSEGQDFAVALAGPTGAPRVSVFSAGTSSLTQTDSLFVMNTGFTGGLFGTPTL